MNSHCPGIDTIISSSYIFRKKVQNLYALPGMFWSQFCIISQIHLSCPHPIPWLLNISQIIYPLLSILHHWHSKLIISQPGWPKQPPNFINSGALFHPFHIPERRIFWKQSDHTVPLLEYFNHFSSHLEIETNIVYMFLKGLHVLFWSVSYILRNLFYS